MDTEMTSAGVPMKNKKRSVHVAYGDDPSGKFTKHYKEKYGKPTAEEMKKAGGRIGSLMKSKKLKIFAPMTK